MLSICIYIYQPTCIYTDSYIYLYICMCMVFTTEGSFEAAIESWPEWDLNPRLLNYVYLHLYLYLSIHLFIYLSIYLFIYLSIHPSIHLSIYLSFYISISLSLYMCVCVYVYKEPRQRCIHINFYLRVHFLKFNHNCFLTSI